MKKREGALGKIKLQVGDMRFYGKGEQDWLNEQIDKLLAAAKSGKFENSHKSAADVPQQESTKTENSEPLAEFLNDKQRNETEARRFLATAAWLFLQGSDSFESRDVTKALQEHAQKKIGNPSRALSRNIARGYCAKTKKGNYVTDEGMEEIGL